MLRGLYGVIKPALLEEYRDSLAAADLAANAAELRLFKRIIPELHNSVWRGDDARKDELSASVRSSPTD